MKTRKLLSMILSVFCLSAMAQVTQNTDGSITLLQSNATEKTGGPCDSGDHVGCWTSDAGYVLWDVNITTAGTYNVFFDYETGNTGTFKITDNGTENFYAFTNVNSEKLLGEIDLTAGNHQLKLERTTNNPGGWDVIDLYKIQLFPKDQEIAQLSDGSVYLGVGFASLDNLIYGKEGSGYERRLVIEKWTDDVTAKATWKVNVTSPGTFRLLSEYVSPGNSGTFKVKINDGTEQSFSHPGGVWGLETKELGTIDLVSGENTIEITHDGEWVSPSKFSLIPSFVAQDANGVVTATADKAQVSGGICVSGTGSSSVIGCWGNGSDEVKFNIQISDVSISSFMLSILYGTFDAGTLNVNVEKESSPVIYNFDYTATGSYDTYVQKDLGKITINSTGNYTITLTRTGGGAVNLKNMILTPSINTSIDFINDGATLLSEKYFTLQGVEISEPVFGIYIVKRIYDNGTVTIDKKIVKK